MKGWGRSWNHWVQVSKVLEVRCFLPVRIRFCHHCILPCNRRVWGITLQWLPMGPRKEGHCSCLWIAATSYKTFTSNTSGSPCMRSQWPASSQAMQSTQPCLMMHLVLLSFASWASWRNQLQVILPCCGTVGAKVQTGSCHFGLCPQLPLDRSSLLH